MLFSLTFRIFKEAPDASLKIITLLLSTLIVTTEKLIGWFSQYFLHTCLVLLVEALTTVCGTEHT